MRSIVGFASWRRALSVAALAWLAAGLPAQATDDTAWRRVADTVFRRPAAGSGLENEFVTAVAQDGDGFLWVGTQDGVARWDGYRFRFYRPDPKDPGSLPNAYVQALHADAQGRVWVGTASGGLSRYDPGTDHFVTYPTGPDGLSSVDVLAIADDGADGVWAATNHGVDRVDAMRGAIDHVRSDDAETTGPADGRAGALLRDREGRLWIGARDVVLRRDDADASIHPIAVPRHGDKPPVVACLYQDASGLIWIGTKNAGAFVLEPGADAPRAVAETDIVAEEVEAIAESPDGEIWLGTYGHGVIAVDPAGHSIRQIRHDPLVPNSLDDDTLWALFRDRSGTIWTGTSRGLGRHDPDRGAILTIFGATSRPTGLSDADVEAVLPRPDGSLWLGTGANGVDFLDPAAGRTGGLHPEPAGDPAPTETFDFVTDPAGAIYVFARNGLFRASPDGRAAVQIATPTTMERGYLPPGSRRMWLGSLADGLWTLDLDTAGPSALRRYMNAEPLTDPRITVLAPGPDGSLWIGTKNGLNRLDPATGAVERIPADPASPTGLGSPYIDTFLTDRRGRLWVGTQGGGISILEARDPQGRWRFRRLGLAEGLPNLNIDKLLEARSGAVWVATDAGLAVIDPDSLAIRPLRQADGSAIAGYWLDAGAMTDDGALVFGGSGGLTIVRPDQVRVWDDKPPMQVTELRVGGKPIALGRFRDGAAIEIPAQANSLAVEFSALDYSAPEQNRYAYRLDGYDPDWIETDWLHRQAAYTNLPPGSYRLDLRGSNGNGVWIEPALSLPIIVLPAWHQTLWFKLVELLLALAAAGLLVQLRTSYLRRRQRQLEHQVAERTAELREREQQLEQMAYFDALTGLANRRLFNEEFGRLSAQVERRGEGFALLLIDLDRFKQINDTLGHDSGDALLIEAARRLQNAVRRSDRVHRLGGDEFAILLSENPDRPAVDEICRRIVEDFTTAIPFNGIEMKTSPSIGVALYPCHGAALESLYKAADLALYEAKRAGRNTWRWSVLRDASAQPEPGKP